MIHGEEEVENKTTMKNVEVDSTLLLPPINTSISESKTEGTLTKEEEKKIFEYLKLNEWRIEILSSNLRSNRNIVLETMKHNGDSLYFVSEELRNDKEIVLEAIKNYKESIYFASTELQNDRDILLELFSKRTNQNEDENENENEEEEEYFLNLNLNNILKKDFELFKFLISKNGMFLNFFSKNEKDRRMITKEIGILGVKQNGNSIKFLKEELKNDREIILEAIKQNGNSLEFIPNKFRNDKEIVFEAIKQNSNSIKFLDLNLNKLIIENEDIIEECLRKNEECWKYLSLKSKNDLNLMKKILKKNRNLFYFFENDEIKNDKEIYFIFNQMYLNLNLNFNHFNDVIFILSSSN